MDIRPATNQIRLSKWTRIIQDSCQSGLKVFVELPALPEKTVPATTAENHFTYQMTIAIGITVLGVSETTSMEILSRVLGGGS